MLSYSTSDYIPEYLGYKAAGPLSYYHLVGRERVEPAASTERPEGYYPRRDRGRPIANLAEPPLSTRSDE